MVLGATTLDLGQQGQAGGQQQGGVERMEGHLPCRGMLLGACQESRERISLHRE